MNQLKYVKIGNLINWHYTSDVRLHIQNLADIMNRVKYNNVLTYHPAIFGFWDFKEEQKDGEYLYTWISAQHPNSTQ